MVGKKDKKRIANILREFLASDEFLELDDTSAVLFGNIVLEGLGLIDQVEHISFFRSIRIVEEICNHIPGNTSKFSVPIEMCAYLDYPCTMEYKSDGRIELNFWKTPEKYTAAEYVQSVLEEQNILKKGTFSDKQWYKIFENDRIIQDVLISSKFMSSN